MKITDSVKINVGDADVMNDEFIDKFIKPALSALFSGVDIKNIKEFSIVCIHGEDD